MAFPVWRSLAALALCAGAVAACGDGGRSTRLCDGGVDGLNALLDATLDPASDEFTDAVDQLEEVEPPDVVASEWRALVDALVDLRDVPSDDVEAINRAAEGVRALDGELARVEEYIREVCGETVGSA